MSDLYNSNWITNAEKLESSHSWVLDVLKSKNGRNYLKTIKTWYQRYPNKSEHLKNFLESFDTASHLGGVNELFWWEFMKKFKWKAQPIKVNREKRPDFHVTKPSEFFCEVTTLNISKKDESALRSESGVGLNHEATIYRILGKVMNEEKEQIVYGCRKGHPSILVLFDYTFWSGLATDFSRTFQQKLFEGDGFAELPKSPSALLYVEKKIIYTRFCVTVKRSAVFHNPYAKYTLPKTVFTMFRQHEKGGAKILPTSSTKLWNGWICLSGRKIMGKQSNVLKFLNCSKTAQQNVLM